MMKILLLSVLMIQGSVHSARSDKSGDKEEDKPGRSKPTAAAPIKIFSQSGAEGSAAYLHCGKNDGRMMWEKCTDGRRPSILRAEGGEITKYKPDPENRYSVLSDLSLMINNLSVSDSGIYCCNSDPVVNLIVIPAITPAGKKHHTPSPDGSCCSPEKSRENHNRKPGTSKPTTAASTTPSTTSPTASISATTSANSSTAPLTTSPPTTSAKSSTETQVTLSQKTTSSTSSAGSAKGGVSNGNHKGITIAVVVVGAGLVLLAVVLMRRCSKQKAQENEHVYATIPDSTAPATQPDSSPPRVYEAVYCLAGDPDIVKLGLKNQAENTTDLVYSTVQPVQPAVLNAPSPDHLYTVLENPTADSPQIPQTPPTVNPSDLVYSMVQPVQ